jgi:hypothetical protein
VNTTWPDLLTTALLGTDRRGGTPTALLDAAATATVRRRAGLRPATAHSRPVPAPPDTRPALPPAAHRRLALLLADRDRTTSSSSSSSPSGAGGGGRRGAAPNLSELLPQWLTSANEHGYAAPPALLPALLDAARARTDLRADALALAGPRALWLAELNPDWKFALRAGARGLAPATDDPSAVRRLWEEGLFAERVAVLTHLRVREPRAALALLRTTWATERAEDRLMFLDSLREGLSPADEPFLDQALSDRSRNVRATAAELLSALPGSALATRMAQRARSCVSFNAAAAGEIIIEAPYECDAAMERDGIAPIPPSGRGKRAWWFAQLIDATPLATWTDRLQGRTPEQIIALPVADDWQADLHAAWCRAAVRQRDPAWARALLGPTPAASTRVATIGDPAKLLSILPEPERSAWVARFIASHGLAEAFQMLGVCAVPWSEPLGRSVVDALDIARDAGSYPWSFSGVMGLAERCLHSSEADGATALTAAPEESADTTPGAGTYWAEAFQRLVSTLRLRAAMLAELEP